MTYDVPKSVVDANRGFVVYDSGSTDHRGLVIRTTCDLENDLASLLFGHFKKCNTEVTWERASKELFSENGLLSSLSKMTRLAVYLGLVTDEESQDLRILGRLRNMYAHGRKRDQFDRDTEATALIKQMRLYQNSLAVFAGSEIEWIYLACAARIAQLLKERAAPGVTNAA